MTALDDDVVRCVGIVWPRRGATSSKCEHNKPGARCPYKLQRSSLILATSASAMGLQAFNTRTSKKKRLVAKTSL